MSPRDTEVDELDVTDESAQAAVEAVDTDSNDRRRSGLMQTVRDRIGPVAILGALIVAFVLAGGYAWWQVREISTASTADDLSHIDPAATNRIESEMTRAAEVLFSYDHERPELAAEHAEELLHGDAYDDWQILYGAFEQQAAEQELTMSLDVRRIGIVELRDDTAQVLVFADQYSAFVGDEAARLATAQLLLDAEFIDGAWRITEIDLI